MNNENEGSNILTLTQSVSQFFIGTQIVALNSFENTEERINVCIYILKDMKQSLYRLLINFGDKWSWSDNHAIEVIAPDYEKLLFHERFVRKIMETVH